MKRVWGLRRCLLCSLSLDSEPEGVTAHAACPEEASRQAPCYKCGKDITKPASRPGPAPTSGLCGDCSPSAMKKAAAKGPMSPQRAGIRRMWAERRGEIPQGPTKSQRERARYQQRVLHALLKRQGAHAAAL
jgi:hypothetical protein